MLKVLTAEQMREVDRLTTERYGIPSILLMESAAHAVARVITEKLGGSVKGKSILILCGPGNNGGDGAALARVLWQQGAEVTVCSTIKAEQAKGDAAPNFESMLKIASAKASTDQLNLLVFRKCSNSDEFDEFCETFFSERDPEFIVDALLGTGLTRPTEGVIADIARYVRSLNVEGVPQETFVLSVDVPTGTNADSGEWVGGPAIRAHGTVTFTSPKPCNVLPPANDFTGDLTIANIGSPQELIDEQPSQLYLADRTGAADWLKKSEFTNASYKNKRGHALIIGGSRDYSGAAVLAGNAGIRSGVGLVTVAVPEDSRDGVIGRVTPEVMVRGISQTQEGSAAEKAADEIAGFLKNVDAVAVGSGLSSKEDETKAFIRRVVEERQTPVVIDADGLTALSPWATNGPRSMYDHIDAGETPAFQSLPLILTPHEGEFKKLLGVEGEEAQEVLTDRVQAVRDFATRFNLILVLKGERSLIGAPDGRVVVNPTGNSGLGKAGNGDTLLGIIAGFVAQAAQMKIDTFETVVAAVYIAGMAGDLAEKKYGKRVMTASDVRDCLADVFEELGRD